MAEWLKRHDGVWLNGLYTIYRYPREFAVYVWDSKPRLIGKCETFLEAQLLASADEAGQSNSYMDGVT